MRNALRSAIPYVIYPSVMTLAIATAYAAQALGLKAGVTIVLSSVMVTIVVVGLERLEPFRVDWGTTAENLKADILHSAISNALPSVILETLLKASLVAFAFYLRTNRGIDLWPDSWPLWTQVLLALFAAEVGFYTLHRFLHESGYESIWKWHALHHSSTRMYFLAGSRTHPLQVMFTFGVTVAILWTLGAPDEVILWKTVVHSTNGILQHCNVDIRLGLLNWIIAGPELHRWHHSSKVAESNSNYGNNLIVLDVLFGTHQVPGAPPKELGLPEGSKMRNNFLGHLALPFLWSQSGNDKISKAASP